MIKSVLGDLTFSTGWKTQRKIVFWGKEQTVTIKARAYTETDGLTPLQEEAFSAFRLQEHNLIETAESLLRAKFPDDDAPRRFSPRTILFERDGSYAVLCDDSEEPDDGVAVVLAPNQTVVSQDEYL